MRTAFAGGCLRHSKEERKFISARKSLVEGKTFLDFVKILFNFL